MVMALSFLSPSELWFHLHGRSAVADGQVLAGLEAQGHLAERVGENAQLDAPDGRDQQIAAIVIRIGRATA